MRLTPNRPLTALIDNENTYLPNYSAKHLAEYIFLYNFALAMVSPCHSHEWGGKGGEKGNG